MKILANDGLSRNGILALENAGFEVIVVKVAQNQLINYINENHIDIIIVRSGTEVRDDIIDDCPSLKMIARAGVGIDNIDVEYAEASGVRVITASDASSSSVAELVFAHLFGMVRFLHDSNRTMPLEGDSNFKGLKKSYAAGTELRGKTLGIIGFGKIGQNVAKIALSLGMKVLACDPYVEEATIELDFYDGQAIHFNVLTTDKEDVLKNSDFITLHTPYQEGHLISVKEIEMMRDGAGIINTSRGGAIDEVALVDALNEDKLFYAGIDTFENEPTPAIQVLMNHKISLTPHIGSSTIEAQARIAHEIAEQIMEAFEV
ncbi:D-2-hydroxyacid dehydrogenase [Aureivirga marina]|uniref:D-2-hydroxyacid dehydrogenase n=1 Tax=Aureivirga marina TaxID=1182451 RepID=UPI0018CB5772|nr:D-2-hydroxyacid dehydrogenase [Aureivirga marina]